MGSSGGVTRRRWPGRAAVAGGAGWAGLLGACGLPGQGEATRGGAGAVRDAAPGSGPALAAPRTVEYWSAAGGGVALQAQEQLLARYGERHPGVTVNTAVAPFVRNVPEKTVAAVAAGTPPDVAVFDRFLIASFAVKQTFLPLTDRARRDGVAAAQYYPFAWREAGYKGQLYALPYQTGVRALFANRGHLREAGLGTALPRTLTELDQWNVRLTRQEGDGITRLGFAPWLGNSHFYTWGWLFGGDFYDEQSGRCVASRPQNVRALEWVGEYARRYGDQRLRAFEGTFGQASGGPFGAGLVSFLHTTQGLIDELARSSPLLEYETLPLPPAPGQDRTSTWTGGFGYIIPRGAKQPDGAWHLMRYLGGEEGELLWTQTTLTLPVRVDVARAPYWQERERDPRMKVFLDLLPVARSRPVMPAAQTLWDELASAVELVRKGEQPAREALEGVTQRVNAELAQVGG